MTLYLLPMHFCSMEFAILKCLNDTTILNYVCNHFWSKKPLKVKNQILPARES